MIAIRRMTAAHLPFLQRLRAQVGWNQTRDDLRRFRALSPDGCFVATWDGKPAGTVCTFVFGSTAWIAMVLVDESLRGRGIGKALMRHALDYLDGHGVERVRLDATPLGRPVYEKLGFVAEYDVLRYHGTVPRTRPPTSKGLVGAGRGRLDQVRRLDAEVTQADRSALVSELYRSRAHFQMMERGGNVEGYVSIRPGESAWQIGPCLATDADGHRLFDWAFYWTQIMQVYVDVPKGNHAPIAAVEAIGLRVQRTLTRMCRGPFPAERTERIWASSGPEKG